MNVLIQISCTDEFKKRLIEHVDKGEYSRWLVNLASKEMDKMDKLKSKKSLQKRYFESVIKPYLREYSEGKDPFFMWRDQENIRNKMSIKNMEISKEDFEDCVSELCNEFEELKSA